MLAFCVSEKIRDETNFSCSVALMFGHEGRCVNNSKDRGSAAMYGIAHKCSLGIAA